MQRKKLLKLANFLEYYIGNREFNLKIWREEKKCGTTACAFGWCPEIWRHSALKVVPGTYDDWNTIEYNGYRGLRAAAKFFDITLDQAEYLFDFVAYRPDHSGRISVAKRLRKFVWDNPPKRPSRRPKVS